MSALVFLSSKSIEIRQKAMQGAKKHEMAEVDEEGDGAIIEDEEDIDIDIDSDEEDDDGWNPDEDDNENLENLYDSPLDDMDEVLFFCEKLQHLEQNNGQEFHAFLMSQLNEADVAKLNESMQAALFFQQKHEEEKQKLE